MSALGQQPDPHRLNLQPFGLNFCGLSPDWRGRWLRVEVDVTEAR